MNKLQPVTPREDKELESTREDHRANQPYASEVDDRELEHAHKEKRPVRPAGGAEPARPAGR